MPTFLNTVIAAGLLIITTLAQAADSITPDQLAQRLKNGDAPLILDVRSAQEYLQSRIDGARLIPHTEISNQLDELAPYKNKEVIVYCRSGRRADIAIEALEAAGFSHVTKLQGSIQGWQQAGNTTVSGEPDQPCVFC